jgi:hypothetical protein
MFHKIDSKLGLLFGRPRFQLNLALFREKDVKELASMAEELVLPFMWAEDGFGEPSEEMAGAIRLVFWLSKYASLRHCKCPLLFVHKIMCFESTILFKRYFRKSCT